MYATLRKNKKKAARMVELLYAIKAIPVEDFEHLVQDAHECHIHQMHDPPERFGITRQALRRLWLFRCQLESVEVEPNHG